MSDKDQEFILKQYYASRAKSLLSSIMPVIKKTAHHPLDDVSSKARVTGAIASIRTSTLLEQYFNRKAKLSNN